jgi:pilus assembly protein CpaE
MPAGKETVRILIVDDMADMRENLRKLLSFENDFEVVGAASNGTEGIKLAKQFQPHIVLMDINMPGGVDGIAASESISQEVPSAAIIMMSVQSESDYLRRSMLAGARDFLTKPFTSDELVSTIRRVYDMNRNRVVMASPAQQAQQAAVREAAAAAATPRGGRIVAVWGTKGGVGSTLLAINIAVALCDESTRVALVDASLQFGDIGVLLNLSSAHSIIDAVPNIEELEGEFLKNLMAPHASGVRVLLAPPRPEQAELINAEQLKIVLQELRRHFDIIVVDTPKNLNDHVLATLDIADRILVVTTAEIPALRNTKLFLEVAETLKYDKNKIMLVVGKYDKRGTGISLQDIEDAIKHKVVGDIVLDQLSATRSVNQGAPLVAGDRTKPLAQAYLQLAARVRKELMPVAEAAAAGGPGKQPATDDKGLGRLGRLFGSGGN